MAGISGLDEDLLVSHLKFYLTKTYGMGHKHSIAVYRNPKTLMLEVHFYLHVRGAKVDLMEAHDLMDVNSDFDISKVLTDQTRASMDLLLG